MGLFKKGPFWNVRSITLAIIFAFFSSRYYIYKPFIDEQEELKKERHKKDLENYVI